MEIHSTIKIKSVDADKLYLCLRPEAAEKDRSSFTVKAPKSDMKLGEKESAKEVICEINSRDAVAFRAGMNALTQMLAVYEKMKNL